MFVSDDQQDPASSSDRRATRQDQGRAVRQDQGSVRQNQASEQKPETWDWSNGVSEESVKKTTAALVSSPSPQ